MLFFDGIALILLAALAIDAVVGDPDFVWRRVPHPVVPIGRLIAALDRRLNAEQASAETKQANGVFAIAVVTGLAVIAGLVLATVSRALPFGWMIEVVIAAIFIAQNSLYRHVADVAAALETGGLDAGRSAVARIVGRDPATLDEAGVSRAAIETLAENFSDGVVAPAFWFLVAGLPGLIAYKSINTADSMIGYRTERHRDFGWAAARLDDVVNIVPARISGLLIAIASGVARAAPADALRIMLRDARLHASPNAGWPEAAMAAATGLALAGPRVYGGAKTTDPFLHDEGRRDAGPADIRVALRVFLAAAALHVLVVAAVWAVAGLAG
ncbi:MAG: adenosylcobinamide-phosphate synthase CbiB [Pseudomonadota bacterium]